MLHKILPLIVLVTATLFGAPIPTATGTNPGEQMIGESFSFPNRAQDSSQICMSNTGDETGYQPGYEMIVPEGVTLDSAQYIGTAVRKELVETCTFTQPGQTECNVTNPYTDRNITLDANETLFLLAYPLGSFPTDMPEQCMDLSFTLGSSPVVTVNVPLDIKTTPLFYLGADALDNPDVDPPIYGNEVTQTVTPVVFDLIKTYNAVEKETVSGSHFPKTVTLSVDIAKGETVENVTVTDDLPGELQYLSLIDADGCSVVSEPSTTVPGGTFSVDCGSITGTTGTEKNIVFSFYVPEKDDNNDSILDPDTGGHNPVLNQSNAEYTYENNVSTDDANDTLVVKPFAIHKNVRIFEDNGVPGLSPTDILEYNITVSLSDYFDMENMIIEDVLNSAQSAVNLDTSSYVIHSTGQSGNFTQGTSVTTTIIASDEHIDFNLSLAMQENGHGTGLTGGDGLSAGTIVTISFHAKINKIHRDLPPDFNSVKAGDLVENNVDMNASNSNDGNAFPSDGSSTVEQIEKGNSVKTVYAINGDTNVAAPYTVKAGDTLTYRIVIDFPINSFEQGVLTDYLPLPVFKSSEMTPGSSPEYQVSATPPSPGQWSTGPLHDVNLTEIDTDFNINTAQNTISWSTDPRELDNNTTRPSTMDLLFTLTATNDPMGDQLNLANLAILSYKNSQGEVLTASSVVNITTYQPEIEAEHLKTIVSSSNSNSHNLTPPDGYDDAMNNVDANDTITYQIHLVNTGHADAYDINVSDRFEQDGTAGQGLHSCIIINEDTNGSGVGSGDLFGGMYSIDIIEAGAFYNINYTCVVNQDANPGEDIDNTATLHSYASTAGGPNFVNKVLESKTKLELTSKMEIVKNIVASSIPDTNPDNNLNQGEIVNFEINVTLGEGTYTNYALTDNTCTGLALQSQSSNVVVSGTTVTILGTGGSVDGMLSYGCEKQAITSGSNTATVTADLMGSKTASTNWTVVDPAVITSKNMNPAQADAGDTVTVTMDWTNDTSHPAYKCSVIDPLDASVFDISTVVMTTTPAGYTCNVVGNEVQCNYTGDLTLPCPDGPAEFTVNIRDDVNTSSTLVNELSFNGVTLPDGHPGENNTSINGRVESNATDTLELRSPSRPVKVFTATSENFTDSGDLNLNNTPEIAIGEVIDVNITYGFYEGTTLNVQLDERFLNGGRLVYVPGSMTISRSDANLNVEDTDINSSLSSAPVNTPVSVDDSKLTITNTLVRLPVGNVLNLNNSSGTFTADLTLHFRVKVQNESSVQSGELIRDRGRVRFEDSISGAIRTSQSDIRSARTYEPLPTITKDVNQSSVQAGTELTYTLKVCNDESNTSNFITSGFDWNIADRIPDDILLSSGPTVDLNGTGAVVDTSASSGQDINATIDRLDRGECISISYEAIVQQSAQFGQIMTNTANFRTTSLPGNYGTAGALSGLATQEPGEINGERTGTGGVNDLFGNDSATVVMNRGAINKVLLSPKTYYAIGDTAQYRIIVDMFPGDAENFVVNDIFPVGMDINTSSITYATTGLVNAEHNPPNVSVLGQVVSFDYGDINVTSPAQFIIDYNGTVSNILSNQDGTSLQNDANVTSNDPNNAGSTITLTPVSPADPVIVGEPNLEMQKRITAGAVKAEAGKTVSWEVLISNDPANNAHTTAYAVDWTDTLPPHLAQISNYQLTTTGTAPVLSGTSTLLNTSHLVENNTTLSLPPFDLPVGSTVTVTFDSIVQNDAVAGETQTNNTDVSYKSILGADGSVLGGRNSDDCGDDDNDTALNNYCESATANLIIDAGIAIDKRLQGTVDRFTIGKQVTYEMRVSVIEGITPNVVLTDTLPAGLKYISHTCQDAGGTLISFDCNLSGTSPVTIDLGDVNNPADGNDTNDFIDVELTVLVENVIGNQNGYKPENGDTAGTLVTVTSDANSSAVTVPVPITITEPDLSVVKTVTPTISGTPSQALGDIITYHIRLAHTASSTSDAYDVNFTDTLDPGLIYIPGSATGAAVTQNGQVLTFGFAHLAQGAIRDISYKAQIDPNTVVGVDLSNSLDTVYGGLPDANGSADGGRNGTDGLGGALNDYALHTEVSVRPNQDELTPVKGVTLGQDTNNDGLISAGDHLEYTLSVTNTLAYDVGDVNVTDTLSPDVTLLLNSVKIDGVAVGNDIPWSFDGTWYTYANAGNDINLTYNIVTNYFEIYWQNVLASTDTLDITFDTKINDGNVTEVVFLDGNSMQLTDKPLVVAGTVIENTFTVDSNRTVPTDSNEVNVTTDQRGIAAIPEKVLTATDQSFTDPGDLNLNNTPEVAVGEVIDVQLTFEFSGGTTRTVVLRDNFDAQNFVYVPGSTRLERSSDLIEVSDSDLNTSFASANPIEVDDSKLSHDANGFDLSLGDVFNRHYDVMNMTETLTLTFQLKVDNNVTVQAGVQLDDNASVSFSEYHADTDSSSITQLHSPSVGVVVVEPDVEITKTVNPLTASSGDMLTYTLKVCNDESNTSAHTTTGFDWEVSDTLPDELDLVGDPQYNGSSMFSGRDLYVVIDEIIPGDCVILEYNVTVNGAAEFEQDIHNTVKVESTSLPGPVPNERTGTGIPPLNDLNNSSTATLHIEEPGVRKEIIGQKAYYPIGDIVEYNITLGFTGSARDLRLVDHFPAGMAYVPGSARLSLPTDANVSYNPPQESNSGYEWTFVIGDLNITTAGNLYLELNATVEDVAGNVNGTQLTNSLDMIYTDPNSGASVTIPAVSPAITVGEPELIVTKSITTDLSVPKSAGDVIGYSIEIMNSGTTTAYFVEWEDKVPVHTGEIHNPHQQVHAGTAYETNTTIPVRDASFIISTVDELDDHIALAPFDLSPGATLVITFDTIIQPNVIPAETLVNTTGATTQSTVFGGRKHTGIHGENYAAVDRVSFSINQLPEAIDDCTPPLHVTHYGANFGDLGKNDILGDGTEAEHTWRVISQPSNGSVVVNTDGTYVYTPDANYNGPDGFIYEIEDSNGDRDRAQVCIDVDCASTQTSDGGDTLNMASMLFMLFFTGLIGLYYVRREEIKGVDHE